ncbi:MAG: site-2 protease family protein [Actinomycetota bacterium]|nr:site-2 protease family protein [Actinomycetota bacterium]
MLLYVLGVVIVVVGLAVSIGLHEIGHLIPAKRFGVKVGQWMIGFGPTLWSRKFGETEYGVKAIPLGGFISMAGMFPPGKVKDGAVDRAGHLRDELELDIVEGDMHDASEDAALARPAAATRAGKPKMDSTGFFNVLVQDARDSSAQTIEAGAEDRVFYKLAFWKRIIIMLGGPAMNLVIAVVLYGVILCGFGIPVASTTIGSVSQCIASSTSQTTCAASDERAPAAAAGIKPGDVFVSIDGTAISSWNQATGIIRKSAGSSLSVVVKRDGQNVTLSLTPKLTERPVVNPTTGAVVTDANGKTVTQNVGFVGIGDATEIQQQPVTAVLPAVGANIASVAKVIFTLPQRLVQVGQAAFGGQKRDPNGPISVLGVGRLAGEITTINSIPILQRISADIQIIAGLNIALFVFNLIPLLPLDGGHVLGAVWEALRRRLAKIFKRPDPGPVDMAKLVPLTLVIVAILGASSALLIYADIVNPVTFQ